MSLNTAADGNIPWFYQLLSGRTADQATVQSNMNNLAQWLQRRGYQPGETLLVGDRAMLNDEIAIAYDQQGLKPLTGLRCLRAEHRQLLTQFPEEQFHSFPIVAGDTLSIGDAAARCCLPMRGTRLPIKVWLFWRDRGVTNCETVVRHN